MNLSILMNFMFLNSKTPLMLGLSLVIQTMLICMMSGMMNYTFWMSYIIFLVFIGGMLILFLYVISMLNNNFVKMMKLKYMIFFTISLTLIIINYMYNYETLIFNKAMHLNNENMMNLMKMYNMPNMIISMLIIIYLFVMMIVTTKITNFLMGPFYKF